MKKYVYLSTSLSNDIIVVFKTNVTKFQIRTFIVDKNEKNI